MNDVRKCVECLHWIFDSRSHVNQVKGVSQNGDEIHIELTDKTKSFSISSCSGVYDLLEQICKGIDEADKWRN